MSETARKAIALAALAENFGAVLSEPLLETWLKLLAGYGAEQVGAAVRKVLETHVYRGLPPFAVLKKALDDLDGLGEEAMEFEACMQWAALGEAIARHGTRNKPSLHPATEQAVRLLGGWRAACGWETGECAFRRRDFIRLWVACRARGEAPGLAAGHTRAALERE